MNDEGQNKRANGMRGIKYRFVPFPMCLVYHPILNEDERGLLLLIARRGPQGCRWGERQFAKRLRISVYHVRRARARLKTLKLITFSRIQGGFLQTFVTSPESWRLTRDLHEQLRIEAVQLNYPEPQFLHPPFESLAHFDSSFAQAFPKLKEGRKGRKAEPETEVDPVDLSESLQAPIEIEESFEEKLKKKFLARIEVLETLGPLKVMADYFENKAHIELVQKNETAELTSEQVKYFAKLEDRFNEIAENPTEHLIGVFNTIDQMISGGADHRSVARFLDSEHRRTRSTQAKTEA